MEGIRGVAVLAAQRAAGEAHEHGGKAHGVGLALQRIEDLGDLETALDCAAVRLMLAIGGQALQALGREARGIRARDTLHARSSSVALRVAIAASAPTA